MATEIDSRPMISSEATRDLSAMEGPTTLDASDSALFDIYQHMVESQSGARDAQIFQKIREWCFSDFSFSPHEFAGVTKVEFDAWQSRHRINLSGGRILPDPRDLQRGYAWSHLRIAASVNHLRSESPPPH